MAHSILLVVSKPDAIDYKIEQNWDNCVSILSGLTNKKTGVRLLAENVVLIPLHDTSGMLSEAVQAAAKFRYSYAILVLSSFLCEI